MIKEVKEVRINVKISRSDRKRFKEYCDKHKYGGISKRIRELIQLDIKGGLCQKD